MSAGAVSPEELESMLEDACLLSDASLLTRLFDDDAVLLTRASSQVRGRSAIAEVIINSLRHGGCYVAAPQLVIQSGRLALIISDAATSVARRNPDGWHYVINRLDLDLLPTAPPRSRLNMATDSVPSPFRKVVGGGVVSLLPVARSTNPRRTTP